MAVAEALGDVELISVDSMQVYRGMDIGTAKPTVAEQARVAHHCIDLVDATADYSVADFKRAHADALDVIESRSGRAILVGGTGLYHRVVIDDFDLPGEWPDVRREVDADSDTEALFARLAALDPEAASKMESSNRRRVVRALEVVIGSGRPFSSFGPGVDHYPHSGVVQLGLRRERAENAVRIEQRVHRMIEAGLVAEVEALCAAGLSKTAGQAIGYKEIREYLEGRVSHDEAVTMIVTRTRQFAVRQERWFRRDPRVQWIDVGDDPVAAVAPIAIDHLTRTS